MSDEVHPTLRICCYAVCQESAQQLRPSICTNHSRPILHLPYGQSAQEVSGIKFEHLVEQTAGRLRVLRCTAGRAYSAKWNLLLFTWPRFEDCILVRRCSPSDLLVISPIEEPQYPGKLAR